MQVTLMHYTDLNTEKYIAHLIYNFTIKGVSRACLMELTRHRIASYSVKSTRYTLKELKNTEPNTLRENLDKYVVLTSDEIVDTASLEALRRIIYLLNKGISNDIVKYALPESFKTELTFTINARSLQNFLELRTSKSALWEIRALAFKIYDKIPKEHQYLFKHSLRGE